MGYLVRHFGWQPNPEATEAYAATCRPEYGEQIARLIESDDNRDCFNYRKLTAVMSKAKSPQRLLVSDRDGRLRLKSRHQLKIGSCVGNATATMLDGLAASEIMAGEPEEWRAPFSAEACYATSREVGGMLGRGDGSYGSAAVKANAQIGTINEMVYSRGDFDLRGYDVARCREYGRTGLPQDLRPFAAKHTLDRYWRLNNGEEAWAAIGADCWVNFCSNYGFDGNRNADGVIARRGSWGHSMCGSSRRTTRAGNRLILIHNSWGDGWTSGPYYQDQPLGSFYVALETIDRMCRSGDCWTNAGLAGFVRREMKWHAW